MHCHTCHCRIEPTRPRTAWKLINLAFWVTSLTLALCFSILAGPNLVLAPAAIFIGMAIGTSARRMSSWTCPHCAAELFEPEPESRLARPPPFVPAAHAA